MSAATLPTSPPATQSRSGGRIVAVIAGALLALAATALLILGGALIWAHTTQRDSDGWYTSPWHRFETPAHALTTEELRLGDVRGGPQDWLADLFSVRVRVRAEDGGPVFVGIAPEGNVDAYLRGVAHTEVVELRRRGYRGIDRAGSRTPAPPAAARLWSASASGPGTRTARWDPASGKWAVAVMNADGRPGVSADVQVGARVGWVLPLGIALLFAAFVLAAGATGLIVFGLTRPDEPPHLDEDPSLRLNR